MSQYSPQAYVAKIRMSSRRHLLVEGPTDRAVLKRLVLALCTEGRAPEAEPQIDTAELISSVEGKVGNGEKVEGAYQAARAAGVSLAVWVDREFRCFDFEPDLVDKLGCHQYEPPGLYWTRGHSVENYLLTADAIIDALASQFAVDLRVGYDLAVRRCFGDVLFSAAAMSIAARDAGLLGRLDGLITHEHWRCAGATVELDWAELEPAVRRRGVSAASARALRTSWTTALARVRKAGIEVARWVAHGHLGLRMVRCGVARALDAYVESPARISQVATGECEEFQKTAASHWASRAAAGAVEAPSELIAWLVTPRQAA